MKRSPSRMLVPLTYLVALVCGSVGLLWFDEHAWHLFQAATLFAPLQMVVAVSSLAVLAVSEWLASSKPRSAFWPVFVPPLLVALVTVPGLFPVPGLIRGFTSTSGETVDPSLYCRIYAGTFSESLGLVVVGGILRSLLMSAGSMMTAVRSGRCGAWAPKSCIASLGAGFATFVLVAVASGVAVHRAVAHPPLAAASLLGVVSVCVAQPALADVRSSTSKNESAGAGLFVLLLGSGPCAASGEPGGAGCEGGRALWPDSAGLGSSWLGSAWSNSAAARLGGAVMVACPRRAHRACYPPHHGSGSVLPPSVPWTCCVRNRW